MRKAVWIPILVIVVLILLGSISYLMYGTIQIEKQIVGTWQSTQDEDYVVTFTNYGAVFEEYKDLKTQGTWDVSRKIDFVDLKNDYDKQLGYFLKTKIEDEFLYSIENIDENEMTLYYISRGTTLSFVRKNSVE